LNLPKLTQIGERSFAYCSSLTNINLPIVTNIGVHCFSYC
jgi:hypothetical protein